MRRGRILLYLAVVLGSLSLGFASAARADDPAPGSPGAICADLQDGKLDGTYSQDQWTTFASDPTVQGYCSVIVPPCVYPGQGGSGGSGGSGGVTCSETTTTTTSTTTTQTVPVTTTTAAPVPLTPVVVVKAAQHTVKPVKAPSVKTPNVKGVSHTVKAPATAAAAAPIATTRTRGTLPFTGAQLALFTIVGLALIASGLLLRSTSRHSQRP